MIASRWTAVALNGSHRVALAAILESGPIPAVQASCAADRRPLPMDLRGIPRRRRQADIEPGIARHGIVVSSRLVPVITSRLKGAIEDFKTAFPRAWTRSGARRRRARRHRDLVRRRGPHRPKEQDHPPLGQARHASERADGPTNRLGLYLRRDLPKQGKGAALIMPRCNTEAMNLHLAEIATQIAPGAHAALVAIRPLASVGPARHAAQHHLDPVAGEMSGAQSAGNVWQFLRDNWLSNRIFEILRRRRRPCCEAWNKLVDQPWRIMSIGLRSGSMGRRCQAADQAACGCEFVRHGSPGERHGRNRRPSDA